ncbi:hypothetical protein BZA05DRAFT_28362 [Tricharina praecox]|uniref:uncharacterized protein n=1 Tax=Tricharina praecox TaxID=43433 RepID=UPI00221F9F5E|nr:uncharacterized protein BZA05DRAFT_28362 [Tricharina praecox]KAI5853414.1 hypothetical protein BZA05DRAFT_28362 [Tricharina praecox]
MLESARPHHPPSSSSSPTAAPTNGSPRPVENGRHRKSVITLDTQNLTKSPMSPRPSSAHSMTSSSGTGSAHPTHETPTSPSSGGGNHAPSRRPSWLTSFSSKFSSTSSVEVQAASGSSTSATTSPTATPEPPKPHNTPPGFLLSTLRRLSSSTARETFGRRASVPSVGLCDRVILNRDQHRERSEIPELDGGKLRKVSFCVDVEVAPCHEDVEARKEARRRRKEAKEKEKEKEKERLKQLMEDGSPEIANCDGAGTDGAPLVASTTTGDAEKKGRGGEMTNGSVDPASGNGAANGTSRDRPQDSTAAEDNPSANPDLAPASGSATDKVPKVRRRIHPKPTTDPLKIYTQCCQLRETKVLPEVKEQLVKENYPTVLRVMDLTGHKFQVADAVTFADFLALVPIKRLILDDCDLTDEILRMVLSALSAVRPIVATTTSEESEGEAKGKPNGKDEKHHRGVVERLSLKKNPKIGREGWRHISCFVHMSHSLKALDLSRIVLPRPMPVHHTTLGRIVQSKDLPSNDATAIFSRALAERLCGHGLEELVMGHCSLSSDQLKLVMKGVVAGGTKRLGLEGNSLTDDGLAMVGQWMKGAGTGGASICEALDLSHNDVQDHIDILSASINELSPLCALSLSNCNLTPASLSSLLPALATLPHFRWLDLSRNPRLFSEQPDSLTLLRRFLPKMKALRKIDLAGTSMTSDHAIALCEILPEVKQLSFFKITENPLIQSGHAGMDEGSMEEGAAVYTALVAAVKVSKTIVRVDIDEAGSSAGEVIHALSKRLLAYCLRNIESGATEEDWTVDTAAVSRDGSEMKHASPDVCVNVGDLEEEDRGANYEYDGDGVWQDEENYVVGGTGVVKALGVCLGNKPHHGARANSLSGFPSLQKVESASSIGSFGEDEAGQEKANEMTKALLTRARNIKARIQPALRKGYTGDIEELSYRRLLFLDETLYRVIHRFEEEYPECRQPLPSIAEPPSKASSSTSGAPLHRITTRITRDDHEFEHDDSPLSPTTTHHTHILKPSSRRGSEVSLHSKYLQNEEGQMHKLGHYMAHEIFSDSPTPSSSSRQSEEPEADAEEMAARKAHRESVLLAVEGYSGEELKRRIMEQEGGVDGYISKIEGEKAARKLSRGPSPLPPTERSRERR